MLHSRITGPASTLFHRLDNVEFHFTPSNQIFLKSGKRETFIHLGGGSHVTFEDQKFPASEAVRAKCVELLKRQRDIRRGWLTQKEENEAWTWN